VAIRAAATPPEQATVFVVARPVGGGMPFAAVRRPAVLLPFDVRLDDLVSMSEERKLSAAKAFEVVVRLSRSGNAAAQDGDWEWRSPPLSALDGVTLEARIAPPAS
jgi:cytochrome c-type biogenesis protein CcmH